MQVRKQQLELDMEPNRLVPSDMTERLHFHFSLSCIGEGNGILYILDILTAFLSQLLVSLKSKNKYLTPTLYEMPW